MANLNISMEYDFALLSQSLSTMQEAWFDNPTPHNLAEVRQELLEELGTAYDKSQQAVKGKRRRKKNKKQAEEQRGATHQLTRIIDSMLTHNQKYHNIKKNLTKIADKIDCSETLYSILNPLVARQIQNCVEQSLLASSSDIQRLEAITMLYGRMQQGMSQIEQVFKSIMESAESFECSNFAEKAVVFLLLHYPQYIPNFVDWEKHVTKQHTQAIASMLVISKIMPSFDLLKKRTIESPRKEEETNDQPEEELEKEQESIDNQRDDRQLQFLHTVTKQKSRIEVTFEQPWLLQISDALRRQNRLP